MKSLSKALRSLVGVVCTLTIMLAVPANAAAQAQATTGEIGGRVADAQGAVVPGVTVTAKSGRTGYVRTVVTDGDGLYSLPLMPPDTYDVTFELSGFGVVTRPIVVTVGSSLTVNQTLQV